MLAGPRPRVFTFLSAASVDEKSAMLVNLGASLAQAGSNVLLFDASAGSRGVAAKLDAVRSATLLQVAQQERALDEAVQAMPQGFGVAVLARGAQRIVPGDADQARRLSNAFKLLTAGGDILLADAELDDDGGLPIDALADGEIVVQVSAGAASIKDAYAIIKRINARFGRRPCGVLVTGTSDAEAKVVFDNLAQVANRYLAVKLHSMGSVPPDDHVKRAARLGRAVIDAFPLAGASVAFRTLAGRFALSDVPGMGLHGISANGATPRM